MEENYFEELLYEYNTYGTKRKIIVDKSAYKHTDLYIWDYNGEVNVSNAFVYAYKGAEIKKKNPNGEEPLLVYDTSDYGTIGAVLSILKNPNYREVLENLDIIAKRKDESLIK